MPDKIWNKDHQDYRIFTIRIIQSPSNIGRITMKITLNKSLYLYFNKIMRFIMRWQGSSEERLPAGRLCCPRKRKFEMGRESAETRISDVRERTFTPWAVTGK